MNNEIPNEPSDEPSTVKKLILKKFCRTWNKMDDTIIEPYLFPTMQYYGFHKYYDHAKSKEEYINYLQYNFENMSDFPEAAAKARVVNLNGKDLVYIRRQYTEMLLDLTVIDEFIVKIVLIQPRSKYKFENFYDDFPELLNIARNSLDEYFKNLSAKNPHIWTWIELTPKQKELMDLCLLYEDHLLCINIGLLRMDPEDDTEEYCYNIPRTELLKVRCGNRDKAIPCLFLIDPLGNPAASGCHLYDARTVEKLSLKWSKCCKN